MAAFPFRFGNPPSFIGRAERWLHPLRRRWTAARLRRRPLPGSILFVCHGNLCRSPFAAEALARSVPGSAVAIAIGSAGFQGSGRPPPALALDAAATFGIDLSGHRSRPLERAELRAADLVVVMEPGQAYAIRDWFGVRPGALVVLGDLDPQPITGRTILDPIRMPLEAFIECYARIDLCVRGLADALLGTAATGRATQIPD